MAHKTLIGGTAYEVSGGKTLIGGTAYSIAGGKTLIGGTGYDVNFGLFFTIGGTIYQVENGMTWAKWIASKYNTNGFSIFNGTYHTNIVVSGGGSIIAKSDYTYPLYGSDLIDVNESYVITRDFPI